VEVEGHAHDRFRGVYYCRACFQHHRAISKLKHRAIRVAVAFLGFVALGVVILLLLYLVDGFPSWK